MSFNCTNGSTLNCDVFPDWLPSIYTYCSVASAVACVVVIISYAYLQRLSGYLPKVLFYRYKRSVNVSVES